MSKSFYLYRVVYTNWVVCTNWAVCTNLKLILNNINIKYYIK